MTDEEVARKLEERERRIDAARSTLSAGFSVGVEVRVLEGVRPYGGKRGKIVGGGTRPDGRAFWTVCLDIVTSTGSCDREYYGSELRAI